MSVLDRYVIREAIPPFLIALALFSFVLGVNPFLEYAKLLLSKGVPVPTVGLLLLTLLPQALSLAIPMAFLTGILMALGRLSGDRESVALLACGVSPLRVLRPVLLMAVVAAGLDMYVLTKLKPDANQLYRDITFRELSAHSDADIKPGVFFERFPGLVLYVKDKAPGGVWSGVLLADTTDIGRPVVTLAERGRLVADPVGRLVRLNLEEAYQYTPGRSDPKVYTASRHDWLSTEVSAESVFGSGSTVLSKGIREMGYADLRARIAEMEAQGLSPHNEVMHLHQLFSFPVACLAFAVIGVALGLSTRRDGRMAAFVLGLAVIVVYYAFMALPEAWAKGDAFRAAPAFPAEWARWIPNLVIGLLGFVALAWQLRASGRALAIALPRGLGGGRRGDPGLAGSGPARKALVIRVPALTLPGPRLLDRYVTRRYAATITLTMAGLLTLLYVGTLIDLAEKLFKGQADGWTFLAFLWHSTPQFVVWIIPAAALVAVLATIGGLARTGELTVMKASGVSLYRAALPLAGLALAWGGVTFLLEDRVLGASNRTAAALNDQIRGRTPHAVDLSNQHWLVGEDGRVYHYAIFEPSGPANAHRATIHSLSVFDAEAAPYRLRSHTHVRRSAFLGDRRWLADAGWIQRFTGDAMTREELGNAVLELEPIEDFRRSQADASQMTFAELRAYVRRLGASGYPVSEQRVDLHRRIASPAAVLIMTLLAVPFGAVAGRRGTLYLVGLSIVLAVAYFLLTTFFAAVGAAGILPAFLAAWAANILFGAAALYLVLGVRT